MLSLKKILNEQLENNIKINFESIEVLDEATNTFNAAMGMYFSKVKDKADFAKYHGTEKIEVFKIDCSKINTISKLSQIIKPMFNDLAQKNKNPKYYQAAAWIEINNIDILGVTSVAGTLNIYPSKHQSIIPLMDAKSKDSGMFVSNVVQDILKLKTDADVKDYFRQANVIYKIALRDYDESDKKRKLSNDRLNVGSRDNKLVQQYLLKLNIAKKFVLKRANQYGCNQQELMNIDGFLTNVINDAGKSLFKEDLYVKRTKDVQDIKIQNDFVLDVHSDMYVLLYLAFIVNSLKNEKYLKEFETTYKALITGKKMIDYHNPSRIILKLDHL